MNQNINHAHNKLTINAPNLRFEAKEITLVNKTAFIPNLVVEEYCTSTRRNAEAILLKELQNGNNETVAAQNLFNRAVAYKQEDLLEKEVLLGEVLSFYEKKLKKIANQIANLKTFLMITLVVVAFLYLLPDNVQSAIRRFF